MREKIRKIFHSIRVKNAPVIEEKRRELEVTPEKEVGATLDKEMTKKLEEIEEVPEEEKIEVKEEVSKSLNGIIEEEEEREWEHLKEAKMIAEKEKPTEKIIVEVKETEKKKIERRKDKTEKPEEGEDEERIKKEIEALSNENFYFTNGNWRVFYRFINAAEKKLDIITNRMSFETFELLFNNVSSAIKIRIIVGHTPNNYDKIKKFKENRGLDLELYICKRVHCKFCIRDEKNILLGSSNLVFTSLGNIQGRGNFEADILSDDPSIIEEASNLFETIWQEKKYVPIHTYGRFLSSGLGIPSQIEELISKTEKELIIFSPNFADKELICALRMFNRNIEIKIVLNWPNKSNEKVKRALNLIRDGKTTDGKRLFSIRSRRQQIHAKIYVFDRKKALISSLNLTQSSWGYMIETALLTSDEEIIEHVTKMIENFDYKIPSSIEIRENGGDGEPPEITEIPDEKYLFFDAEGKKFLKKCGQLYDKFINEYGEEFPERIPEEPEEVETLPIEEVTKKPEVIEAPSTEEVTEKPELIEIPSTEEVTEKPEPIETPSTEEVTKKPEIIETPLPEKLVDLAIKQKTAVVIGENRKWRLGKGFSNEEIKRARISRIYRPLHTDKRRKTCYEHNIQIIRKTSRTIIKSKR